MEKKISTFTEFEDEFEKKNSEFDSAGIYVINIESHSQSLENELKKMREGGAANSQYYLDKEQEFKSNRELLEGALINEKEKANDLFSLKESYPHYAEQLRKKYQQRYLKDEINAIKIPRSLLGDGKQYVSKLDEYINTFKEEPKKKKINPDRRDKDIADTLEP